VVDSAGRDCALPDLLTIELAECPESSGADENHRRRSTLPTRSWASSPTRPRVCVR